MKKNKLISALLIIFCVSALGVSCSDDDGSKASAGFAGIATSYLEGDGDATVMIPFVNGSVSESDLIIDGTATAGEDYEILGITDAGIEIKLLEDDDCEPLEKIRFRIAGGGNGNSVHTVTIVSNSDEAFTTEELVGTYELAVDDWADYPVGTELTVERVDDTHIRVVDYPATGFSHVDMVITINSLSTGAATVESQDNGSYNASGTQQTTTSGTGSVSKCGGTIDLTLSFVLPCCGTFGGNHFVLEKVAEE